MKMAIQPKMLIAAALAAFAVMGCQPQAGGENGDAYPTRPIVLVVPFAPGGASDLIARLMQSRLSALLGQQVVVDNRDGGAGNVAMNYVARAKPDGYTLLVGNVGAIAINPTLFKDLQVSPADDFIPISIVAEVPSVLIANPRFAPNTVAEFVDYARARPGKINFASPGTGSLNRLEMEMLRRDAQLSVVHVPYKGSSTTAMTDVMGGHVDVLFLTLSTAVNQIKDGRLKALGVTSKERSPSLPEALTFAEQGYPAIISSSWQGIFAPKGTPAPVLAKLHAAIVEVMRDPSIQARLQETGGIARSSATMEEARAYVAAETKLWSALATSTASKAD